MPRTFLADAKPGDYLEDVFVITNKQLSASRAGKPFIKAMLGDRTMQVAARMWDAKPEWFDAMPDGGFVHASGRVENYQDNLQFVIERFDHVDPADVRVEDLLPTTARDVGQMFERVRALLEPIGNRHLKAVVGAYLGDEKLMAQFRRAPAAVSFHHAFIGGLLEHTLNAMEVASAACPFYPALNRDLVVAGIFLHDLAKTWELGYDAAFTYTDGGQLVGHIVKGALWLEDKARAAGRTLGEPIPRKLTDLLQHIILSHHGEREFGAAVTPATPEAIAVHVFENLDAKLIPALAATRGPTAGAGDWTEYLRAFNGRLYRPDLFAPTDTSASANPSPTPTAAAAPADVAKPAGESQMLTNPLFGEMNRRR